MKWHLFSGVFLMVVCLSVFVAVEESAGGGGVGRVHGVVTSYGNRPAPHTLVFVESVSGDFTPPEDHAVMDQVDSDFNPRMLPILRGTTVDFVNSDEGWRDIYSPEQSVTPFNLGTYPPGRSRSMRFDNVGVAPVTSFMHSEMRAYVIVLDNPHYAVTDKLGRFVIDAVPAGTHILRVWNEKRYAAKQEITVEDGGDLSVDFELVD